MHLNYVHKIIYTLYYLKMLDFGQYADFLA